MADLLGTDSVIDSHALYDCHDLLLKHKVALFDHLVSRWRDLFNLSFDVLLYDLDEHVLRRARRSLALPAGEIPAPARGEAAPPEIEPWAYGGNDMS